MTIGIPRNHGCRISDDWSYRGLRTVVLENSLLRVTVLVDRGSQIVEFRYKPLDLDLLHFNPNGWLASQEDFPGDYITGWQEVLPSAGQPASWRGVDWGPHGELNQMPWEYAVIEDTPERVMVHLSARPGRFPISLDKRLSLEAGKAALQIEERLTSEAGEQLRLMWGHRISFGLPFLKEGAVLNSSARTVQSHPAQPDYQMRRYKAEAISSWPQLLDPLGGPVDASLIPAHGRSSTQEMIYLSNFESGWCAITNPELKLGFALSFDPALFKYVWHLEQLGAYSLGFPRWRRSHYITLEPWTSFPAKGLREAIDNGTSLVLAPGQQIYTKLTAQVLAGFKQVTGIDPDGVVQGV
jgi:Domain of unknown function (DUF4432)